MSQKSGPPETAEQHIKNIRRVTRKRYSTEEKIRVVLSGVRGEYSIAELCPHEGSAESLYYSWSKEFLEAGMRAVTKPRLRSQFLCNHEIGSDGRPIRL
jgi:transposase